MAFGASQIYLSKWGSRRVNFSSLQHNWNCGVIGNNNKVMIPNDVNFCQSPQYRLANSVTYLTSRWVPSLVFVGTDG